MLYYGLITISITFNYPQIFKIVDLNCFHDCQIFRFFYLYINSVTDLTNKHDPLKGHAGHAYKREGAYCTCSYKRNSINSGKRLISPFH